MNFMKPTWPYGCLSEETAQVLRQYIDNEIRGKRDFHSVIILTDFEEEVGNVVGEIYSYYFTKLIGHKVLISLRSPPIVQPADFVNLYVEVPKTPGKRWQPSLRERVVSAISAKAWSICKNSRGVRPTNEDIRSA